MKNGNNNMKHSEMGYIYWLPVSIRSELEYHFTFDHWLFFHLVTLSLLDINYFEKSDIQKACKLLVSRWQLSRELETCTYLDTEYCNVDLY